MKDIKAIFFDFDNTLGNRFAYAYKTHTQFIEEFLPEVTDRLQKEAMVQDLLTFDGMGNTNVLVSLELFENKHKIKVPCDDYASWWREHQYKNTVLNKDVIETLEVLKKKYQLGIITNGSAESQGGKVELSGIKDFFNVVVISGSIGIHKPDKRIYEMAAQQLGLSCQQCLYVGDTFSNDIYGALNAGMDAIWIWPNELRPCSVEVKRIKEFKELLNYL